MSVPLPIVSCDGCGACCMHIGAPPGLFAAYASPKFDGKLLTDAGDFQIWQSLPAELRAELTAFYESGEFRERDGMPCIWLDVETKLCKHHAHRPETCREFEIGCDSCVRHRKWCGVSSPEPMDSRFRVAVHEAGHAVADLHFGLGVALVTIKAKDDESVGACARLADLPKWISPWEIRASDEYDFDNDEELDAEIVRIESQQTEAYTNALRAFMAGRAAEETVFGDYDQDGYSRDQEGSLLLIRRLDPEDAEAFYAAQLNAMRQLFQRPKYRRQIDCIAEELLERTTLTGSKLEALLHAESVSDGTN